MSAELEEMALLSSANSRTGGMVAELEALKLQLIERDETIQRMVTERQQEQAQQMQILTEETTTFKRELSFLEEARSKLEESLAQSQLERDLQEERSRQLAQELERLQVVGTQDKQTREDEHWALQATIERLTTQISELEEQHSSEMGRLQQDHEELLETVVLKHASALTDLSEQAKTDYEQRWALQREELERQFRQDHQELLSRERVLQARWEEQSRKNQDLQERLFRLEQDRASYEEEKETWRQTNQSLERQLAMEHLQQQETMYRIETVEKENRRRREILAELNLAAVQDRIALSGGGDHEAGSSGETLDPQGVEKNTLNDNNDNDQGRPSRTEIVALYESQRQRWKDQTLLLERKMAKSEEEATAIMQKNMELMVALEMAQSLHNN